MLLAFLLMFCFGVEVTYHSFSIVITGINSLGIEVGPGAKVMAFACIRARGKCEGDEWVVSEGSSLEGNKGRKITWAGSWADLNGAGQGWSPG